MLKNDELQWFNYERNTNNISEIQQAPTNAFKL